MNTDEVTTKIREILKNHGRLSVDPGTFADDTDLYQAGLTSHASVSIMLALEGAFSIEFPDQMLSRGVFSTIENIRGAVQSLTTVAA